ncbi:MAG: pyruvate formate lyase family protein [Dehalococcoidia bacterium]|nr:pyruvate formate lyase family protein [Dehalococcoidia bacterium]
MVTVTRERTEEGARWAITGRNQKLKEAYLKDLVVQVSAERSHLFTEYFKNSDGEPPALRRAKAFARVLEGMTIVIHDNELIVGSSTPFVRGCNAYPEFAVGWVKAEVDKLGERENQRLRISPKDRAELLSDAEYWTGKCIQDRSEEMWRGVWGQKVDDAIEARIFHDLTPWPQGRASPGYARVLERGLKGIISDTRANLRGMVVASHEDLQKKNFWEAVIVTSQAVITFAHRHAQMAREMAKSENDPQRRRELESIAEACDWVPENAPRTFHEALQSFWFTHLAVQLENSSAGYSPGRMDQYMFPFYDGDLSAGRLTREEAGEMLGCLWVKFVELDRFRSASYTQLSQSMFQNITIGGETADGRDAVNDLSYLVLEVTDQMRLPQPTVSLRYFDGLPEKFLLRALEVVRDWGAGMPAWFNDKAALSILPHYGVTLRDARNYVAVGCVEMGVPGGSPLLLGSGFLSLAKCLELALNDGLDPLTGKQVGPSTGDPLSFGMYDDLYQAFKSQLAYALDLMNDSFNMAYALHPDVAPIPFFSSLMDDCVQKGKDITQGGCRYNGLVCWFPREMIDTANSLAAVKKRVYDEASITIEDLLVALKADFQGKEEIHKLLTTAPNYGNDDEYADSITNDLFQLCKELGDERKNAYGEKLATGFLGITAHYYFGKATGATPNGRHAYTPFTDGSLSAYPGTDTNGPTAVVMSATKVDWAPALCTLFNLKFHPASLKGREGLRNLLSLVKTYFDLYGWHIQFNVLNRETLLAARKNPEKYRDLVVRVAGFSMFWVDLAPDVQDEIIARTEHSF